MSKKSSDFHLFSNLEKLKTASDGTFRATHIAIKLGQFRVTLLTSENLFCIDILWVYCPSFALSSKVKIIDIGWV